MIDGQQRNGAKWWQWSNEFTETVEPSEVNGLTVCSEGWLIRSWERSSNRYQYFSLPLESETTTPAQRQKWFDLLLEKWTSPPFTQNAKNITYAVKKPGFFPISFERGKWDFCTDLEGEKLLANFEAPLAQSCLLFSATSYDTIFYCHRFLERRRAGISLLRILTAYL